MMMKYLQKIVFLLLFAFLCTNNALCQQIKNANATAYSLAKQYIAEDKPNEAASLLEDIIDNQFRYDYYQLLSSVYYQTNNYKKLEKLIKKAIKLNNDDTKYAIDLGYFYVNTGEKQKGEKQYDKVIKNLKPNNTEILLTANNFALIRQYEQVIQTYKQGRKLFNDPTRYTYEITAVYQLLGKNKDIADEYMLLLEHNPKLLNQIEVNINNLFQRDKDNNLYDIFALSVLEKLKAYPENLELNKLYYWLQMQKGDYPSAFIQAKAIDKRFNNNNYYMVKEFVDNALNAGEYTSALNAYEFLIKHATDEWSIRDIKQNRLTCLYNQFTSSLTHTPKQISDLQKEYTKTFGELGYTKETASIMIQYADLCAFHSNQPQDAVDILDSVINMKSISSLTKAQCKLLRADIFLINGDIWEASLTYSQVDKDFKNETIGSLAKYKNALLSYYNCDFTWALSQFDALRSSTTKLIANDAMEYSLLITDNMDYDSSYTALTLFAKAEFELYKNNIQKAKQYLDSILHSYNTHPLMDEVLLKHAQIAIKEQDFNLAEQYLVTITEQYPNELTTDDALFMLGELYTEQLNNPTKAKQCFEEIILSYPSSVYLHQARKKLK